MDKTARDLVCLISYTVIGLFRKHAEQIPFLLFVVYIWLTKENPICEKPNQPC